MREAFYILESGIHYTTSTPIPDRTTERNPAEIPGYEVVELAVPLDRTFWIASSTSEILGAVSF
jgi:hypothetical protein